MSVYKNTKMIPQNKYHDLECCERTRGIDNLLSLYKQDRDTIIALMVNNPDELINVIWKHEGPLAIDNACRCQMGHGDRRTAFACAQCKSIRRIIDFRSGGEDKCFQVECGSYVGKMLMITSIDILSPCLNWDDEACRRAQCYIQQYQNLTICGTRDMINTRCISGDKFTVRTLITWMIGDHFAKKGLPHYLNLHTAFICSDKAYSMYDMPDIGTLEELHKIKLHHDLNLVPTMKSQHFAHMPLKNSIARTIITQLLVTLLELSTMNFSHGAPSTQAIIFTKDPISYSYDGFHVLGAITLKLTDMWNSSATFGNYHYFPKNIKSSMYIERSMFIPDIATKTIEHCKDNICETSNVTFYRLTTSTIDIYTAMRHIGFPLYVGSFDFYCFMVSLMCDKSFFDAVCFDKKLYSLWTVMWLTDDLCNVERSIRAVHESEEDSHFNCQTAVNIIRGAWLRCDIIKYIWSLIKSGL